ncbi:MAG: hypothetical protein ACRDS0_31515, partial [Pseudonocardiaceae bacterium]
YPHGQSKQMAAQSAGGGDLHVTAEWIGGNAADPFFMWMRDNIRIRVGRGPNSVQKALGG